MLPVNEPRAEPDKIGGAGELEATLREVVERLAPLERTPCSPGEREAAEWLAERFRRIPGVEVALEDEPSWGIFPPTSTALGLLGMAAAGLVLAGRRASGALVAALSYAGIVDEATFWTCDFVLADGASARMVWLPSGSATYAVPAKFRTALTFDGLSRPAGKTILVDTEPVLLHS